NTSGSCQLGCWASSTSRATMRQAREPTRGLVTGVLRLRITRSRHRPPSPMDCKVPASSWITSFCAVADGLWIATSRCPSLSHCSSSWYGQRTPVLSWTMVCARSMISLASTAIGSALSLYQCPGLVAQGVGDRLADLCLERVELGFAVGREQLRIALGHQFADCHHHVVNGHAVVGRGRQLNRGGSHFAHAGRQGGTDQRGAQRTRYAGLEQRRDAAYRNHRRVVRNVLSHCVPSKKGGPKATQSHP